MNQKGFTLVEVLIAMVVMVIALTIIAQGFSTGARVSTVSQNATRAAYLAQGLITDLEIGERPLDRGESGTFDEDPNFSFEIAPEADEPGVTMVTVTVIWEERSQERTYELVRLMFNPQEEMP